MIIGTGTGNSTLPARRENLYKISIRREGILQTGSSKFKSNETSGREPVAGSIRLLASKDRKAESEADATLEEWHL